MTYPLVPARVARAGGGAMDTDTFARAAGLHPELVRRLAVLGLIEYIPDASGHPWFPAGQLAVVARIQRLRAGLCLNYAAVGVVVDLLDRVAELEAALQQRPHRPIQSPGG